VNTRSVTLRSLAITLTIVMTWAIVASANHLFIDMALGGLVIAASWWIARRIESRRHPATQPAALPVRERFRAAA
jgi:predicted PurR-regulated permease PerM